MTSKLAARATKDRAGYNTLVQGSDRVTVNNKPSVRLGDCDDEGIPVSEASEKVFIDGKGAARHEDMVGDKPIAVGGNPRVKIG
jgi:uncharacterized Zn-binding protein involved in type VI secretion